MGWFSVKPTDIYRVPLLEFQTLALLSVSAEVKGHSCWTGVVVFKTEFGGGGFRTNFQSKNFCLSPVLSFLLLNSVALHGDGCPICQSVEKELIRLSRELNCSLQVGQALSRKPASHCHTHTLSLSLTTSECVKCQEVKSCEEQGNKARTIVSPSIGEDSVRTTFYFLMGQEPTMEHNNRPQARTD